MIIISVISRILITLYPLSNALDVVSYGLIVLLVTDTKRHAETFASMNLLAVIVRRQRTYLKIYLRNIELIHISTTL
jgi:hypothetical protein